MGLIGEIVNISADESVVTDGVVDIKKLKPISLICLGMRTSALVRKSVMLLRMELRLSRK